MFQSFLQDGSVKRASIDRELAKSLVRMAKFRFEKAKTEKQEKDNAFFIVENSYEAVRELIDAIMALDGFKSYSHEAGIDFLKEFYKKDASMSIISSIDRYRKLRNDIKYRGILPSLNEGEAALTDLGEAFAILEKIIQKKMA